jgi:hypothetical protein
MTNSINLKLTIMITLIAPLVFLVEGFRFSELNLRKRRNIALRGSKGNTNEILIQPFSGRGYTLNEQK